MKKNVMIFFLTALCACILSGCSVSFSKGKEEKTVTMNNLIDAVPDGKVEMEDMTLVLPDGMKYGLQSTDEGRVYYVWNTNAEQVTPQSEDILLYVYEGNDINSPDNELTNQEARISIQSYLQIFRGISNASISSDPDVAVNDKWYVLQFTGYSGEYETTSYGKACYPKYYYGVYTLQSTTDDYNRKFYGFIFSNDSKGTVMNEEDYNYIFNQIKDSFVIKEFYTIPQMEYDAAKDYSDGYDYNQFLRVFADVQNYQGIQKNKTGYAEYDFVRVEKNNTITVSDGITNVNMKLIGLEFPVTVSDNNASSGGSTTEIQVRECVEQLLTNEKVYLEYEDEIENAAYLFLNETESMIMLNEILLEKGLARYIAEPGIKYAEEFEKAENEAKKNKKGFWGTGDFGLEKN